MNADTSPVNPDIPKDAPVIELGQTGNDFGFTSSTIASSAITGGSFVYLDVTSISGGITGLQAFMTFEGA